MTLFIIIVRIPFGLLASFILIGWTFAFGAWFGARFAYYTKSGIKTPVIHKKGEALR